MLRFLLWFWVWLFDLRIWRDWRTRVAALSRSIWVDVAISWNSMKQTIGKRFRKFQEMNSGAQGISGSDSVANKWHGPWSSYMVIWWERQSGPKVERLNNTKIENTNRQSPKSLLRLFFCIFTYFRWTHRHIIVILPWYRHKKSHLFLLNATFLIAPPVL